MLKKLFVSIFLLLTTISSFLSAEIKYEVLDIGTLQTHSSQAIAINNQEQILGWYNINGSKEEKHFFIRDRDGIFHEIPNKENEDGVAIDWGYLTDDCKVYGTYDNGTFSVLYIWDKYNGVASLGKLPGRQIRTINNSGQILFQSVMKNENGKSIYYPVVWQDGNITKLNGLQGNIGIASKQSCASAINNKGEVVGRSLIPLVYKNNIYEQFHAIKWSNGQAIDLHTQIPKTVESYAVAINDLGEVLISSAGHNTIYFVRNDGQTFIFDGFSKNLNNQYIYSDMHVMDRENNLVINIMKLNELIINDANSIWMKITKIIRVNENGQIIADGITVYGEQHAMLLSPIKSI